ncbi:N-acetylmuramoyl-L-alanine amidase [Nocardia sp. 004]|uniref:N-acetylmuramoyl-L-alanine amidase n=1 Tax=Nocardia sp. 004 TaxID=3385978 RepID=UPI0039A3D83D
MLVRYRKPKRSYALPMVTALAVAAPLATLMFGDSNNYHAASDSEPVSVPTQLTEIALTQAPDTVLPLRELNGLDLPDLRLSDLRMLETPESVPAPAGLPLPTEPRLPEEFPLPSDNSGQPAAPETTPVPAPHRPQPPAARILAANPRDTRLLADPVRLQPGTTADTPALSPGAIPPELMDQVGAQVKELSSEKPFSMVALTADELANTRAAIRAKQPDGAWGAWYDAEPVGTNHSGASTDGTEPIYVGTTNAVQVLVTRTPTPQATAITPQVTTMTPPALGADHTARRPVEHTSDPAEHIAGLTAVLIDPGRGPADGALHAAAVALPAGGPGVITRAQWGADESLRCAGPVFDNGLGGVTVHHTAGSNNYGRSESAGIVRAIYAYHARTLGWCDIGYHALVDRYGQIFEGRFGGLTLPVQGAHAGGFNENTSGIALMGNYESQQPTNEAINALGTIAGWRAKVAALDPKGYTTMYSEGTSYTPYARGTAVQLPIIFAHRDVGNTDCPGDAAYALMDRIRDIAAGAPGSPLLAIPPIPGLPALPALPAISQDDLTALAEFTIKLLNLVHDNIIAKYWAQSGGPTGPLGIALSDVLPAAQGQQYAKFTNGYVYTTPEGQTVEVLGAIRDRFVQLGADAGALGLPLRNAYPVHDGLRAEFQHGALILERNTGIVTTVWETSGASHPVQPQQSNPPAGR